jgi:hypothetical protein
MTFNANIGTPAPTAPINVYATRIGNMVTITVAGTLLTTTASVQFFTSNSVLASTFRPTQGTAMAPFFPIEAGSLTTPMGTFNVLANGQLVIYKDAVTTSPWLDSANNGWNQLSNTYNV